MSLSTSKYLPRMVALILALALLLSGVLVFARATAPRSVGQTMGYESRLLDPARVHTIDLVMDDWEGFLAECESEEYTACAAVIDGESYKNIAIRAKGNTSLSSVSALNSDRYSFKLEFDHYDSTKTYHGLDKLNLNNLIFDNTMMKDYLTYRMMGLFGVAAPLCSFVYVTVNGEDFGLYLAVEGVEDGFLTRNYGGTGELYKPDSMSFGGGRGNGRDFDVGDLDFDQLAEKLDELKNSGDLPEFAQKALENLPEDFDFENVDFSQLADAAQGMMSGAEPPNAGDAQPMAPTSQDGQQPPDGEFTPNGQQPPDGETAPNGQQEAEQPPEMPREGAFDGEQPTEPENFVQNGFDPGQQGGFGGGMGSEDVKLQYIDDDPASYANIFDNAKTDVSEADQVRLIDALCQLSNQEDLERVLDIDAVLRYFVVHSFVVNGDSYTGSMVHNYYLYEQDGQLSMIPWDYNLAFGTFQGNDASSAGNDPIDEALSDRPMQSWIFSDEQYTAQYHALYAQFLQSVDIAGLIDEAAALIAPYVERDPTKFCTTKDFETGVAALKSFCNLRSESVAGQLEGTVPSTESAQRETPDALIDTDGLLLSDMGTMTNGGHGAQDGRPGMERTEQGAQPEQPEKPNTPDTETTTRPDAPVMETVEQPDAQPAAGEDAAETAPTPERPDTMPGRGELNTPPGGKTTTSGALSLAISVLVLLVALLFAWKYRSRL